MMVGELHPKVRLELLDTLTNLIEAGAFDCKYHDYVYKMLIKYAYRTSLEKVMTFQIHLENTLEYTIRRKRIEKCLRTRHSCRLFSNFFKLYRRSCR